MTDSTIKRSELQHPSDPLPARGSRNKSFLGSATFVGLRSLDPFLQYSLLVAQSSPYSLFALLGSQTEAPYLGYGASPLLNGLGSSLGLSPAAAILLLMSLGSTVRQVYWHLFVSLEPLPAGLSGATGFSLFNTFCNTLNSLMFIYTAKSNPSWSNSILLTSSALYILGAFLETYSDMQKRWFKDDPRNAGKPYGGGLSSVARHMNYTGYTIWRVAYGVAAGGLFAAGFYVPWFLFVFINQSVPALDHYLTKKYGKQWEQIQKQTPWKMFPHIW